MNPFEEHLRTCRLLHIQQQWEHFELFGFETRNKYKILDQDMKLVAYAAELSTGIGGAIIRHFLGHWRPFKIVIYSPEKEKLYTLDFPFRFFMKTLFVKDKNDKEMGYLQQRFAFFRKKFDVRNENGMILARINSSFFKLWTFEFMFRERSLGKIQKKWSGALSEFFTDKDNFVVTYKSQELSTDLKVLMLATCLMVDVIYFENNKASIKDLLPD